MSIIGCDDGVVERDRSRGVAECGWGVWVEGGCVVKMKVGEGIEGSRRFWWDD